MATVYVAAEIDPAELAGSLNLSANIIFFSSGPLGLFLAGPEHLATVR